ASPRQPLPPTGRYRTGAPLFAAPPRGRPRRAAPTFVRPDLPASADARALCLTAGQRWRTRQAGLFRFLPLLARLRFDDLVRRAGYPGSRMVPPPSALLSLLALKLLDKERRSPI